MAASFCGWPAARKRLALDGPETPACDEAAAIGLRRLAGDAPHSDPRYPNPPIVDGTVHPGSTAQTGLAFLAAGNRLAAAEMLDLLPGIAVDEDGFALLPYRFDVPAVGVQMRAPCYAAMDQGLALSLAVRLGDRVFADRMLPALLGPSPVASETATGLWLGEYPLDPPDPVLNGAIFAAYGLYDEWAATGSVEARGALLSALVAIRADLATFRNPGRMPWYDLDRRLSINAEYIDVYDSQMATLSSMTGDACFLDMRRAFRYDVGG